MYLFRRRGWSPRRGSSTLTLALGLLAWLSCTAPRPPGEPMQTSCPAEIELPTVGECREEAWKIRGDELPMSCVLSQCGAIKVTCSEWSRRKCKELDKIRGGMTLAFTISAMDTTWYNRVKETHWCEEPSSHACVVKAVIHELAHSCGWDHGGNPSVPGNEGSKPPCECSREESGSKSCK
jgi:hypothetical protein